MTWRALSVIQPWAWLLLRPDLVGADVRAAARARGLIKDVENRGWSTDVRGWVLVHASATKLAKWDWASAALFAAKRGVDLPLQGELPRGAYVGAMRIDGCEPHLRSRWFTGDGWGFVVGDARAFAEPIYAAGTLGFFDPLARMDPEVALHRRGQLARALTAAGLAPEFGVTS